MSESLKKVMTALESRSVLTLSGAYSLRMLGMYLALPILSPYAASLPGGASFWVGMAVGVYGIGQAIFQIPFGIISDRVGRRPAILTGLAMFGVGSLVAAVAHTAPVLVLGRFLQGIGAISSVVVATIADLTREEVRQRAMTLLGINIGVAFGLGLVMGPILAAHVGVPGLFYLSAGLALVAVVATFFLVPEPRISTHAPRPTLRQIIAVFRRPVLLRINLAMIALHTGVTGIFVVLPLQVEKFVPRGDLWKLYGPAIGVGLLAMLTTAEMVDRKRVNKEVLLTGATCLTAGALILRAGLNTHAGIFWGLVVFVLGFAMIEPILPTLVTQYASSVVRGTAAGSFNMSQFAGAGLGGIIGAYFLAHDRADLFWMISGLGLLILVLGTTLTNPRNFRYFEAPAGILTPDQWRGIQSDLLARPGVLDAVYDPDHSCVKIKYVKGKTTEDAVKAGVPYVAVT